MRLGRVVGAVWGAKHAAGLDGAKLLVVEDAGGGRVTAIDKLGAGVGDQVLVAHGTRVRDLTVGETVALKDVVVAIVDGVDAVDDGVDAVDDGVDAVDDGVDAVDGGVAAGGGGA